MSIRTLLKETLGTANAVLGVPCVYTGKAEPVNIFINKNHEIRDTHGILAGYDITGKIDKADVPDLRIHDTFTDDEGVNYRVTNVLKETYVSYYVNLVVINGL